MHVALCMYVRTRSLGSNCVYTSYEYNIWCDLRRLTTPGTIPARHLQVERLEEALRAAEESCSNTQREAGDAASTAEAEILRYCYTTGGI